MFVATGLSRHRHDAGQFRAAARTYDRGQLHHAATIRRGSGTLGQRQLHDAFVHPLDRVGATPVTLVFNVSVAENLTDNRHSTTQGPVDTRTLAILAFSATAGVLVEFYDFAIFGFAVATVFPDIFFPKLPPTQALLFSYLAYAAGHPARLLGALVFGHFGDRAGRKVAFLINIVVVGASTCLTGLLPG